MIRRRILLVEDNLVARKALSKTLHTLGYHRVDATENAGDALRLLLVDYYDLILIDWHLPDLSGLDLARRIRSWVKHQDMPIIMVTGETEEEKVREALAVGIQNYLVKPVLKSRLEEALNEIFPPRTA